VNAPPMRHLLVGVVVLVLVALAGPALANPLLAGVEPGPHAVGFREIERQDHARPYWPPFDLDGKPRAGNHARPMRISIWYPARPSKTRPLTVGDYVALMGLEGRLGPGSPERVKAGQTAFFAFEILRDLDAAQRAKLLALPTIAVRDATPAAGKFPVVIYSLGSPAIGHATAELLASHGYVVLQAPRVGAYAGLPGNDRDLADLATKLADMDFLVNTAGELPYADVTQLATIGWSAGGRWSLAYAMKNPHVRAVVSLDTGMLFDDPGAKLWRASPGYSLENVRAAVLDAASQRFAAQEDLKMWEGLRFAPRTRMVFEAPGLDHMDFQSAGLASTLAGGRAEKAEVVRQATATWTRATLAFLDTHVKGKPQAEVKADKVAVTRIAAEPAPFTLAAFAAALADDVPAAAAAYRRQRELLKRPPLLEREVNAMAYRLLLTGHAPESIVIFQLNTETFPGSANAHDSLADAYLAAGDRARAKEHTEKAHALFSTDKTIAAETRDALRKSIDDKRGQLK
jgi:hypothetical protein